MLLNADMPAAKDYEVRDRNGRVIGGVLSYDSNTKEIEMYVFDNSGKPVAGACGEEVARARFVLDGSNLVSKLTGDVVRL